MKTFKNVLLVVLVIVIAFAIILNMTVPENTEAEYPDQAKAYVMAKQFVKQNLKDPKSADFIEENLKVMDYPNDSTYVFNGYVKATNGLGLVAPVEYKINLKWSGYKWNEQQSWEVKDLTIN